MGVGGAGKEHGVDSDSSVGVLASQRRRTKRKAAEADDHIFNGHDDGSDEDEVGLAEAVDPVVAVLAADAVAAGRVPWVWSNRSHISSSCGPTLCRSLSSSTAFTAAS